MKDEYVDTSLDGKLDVGQTIQHMKNEVSSFPTMIFFYLSSMIYCLERAGLRMHKDGSRVSYLLLICIFICLFHVIRLVI